MPTAARAADLDYGLNESLALRPPDLRQLLDRDHRRGALAQPAALRDDASRRHRAAPALAERRGEPALRLSRRTRTTTPKNGDLFPANTPYLLVSRGSSGSDKPFLEALALTYAAFRPDTKARLVAEDLLVPTVQMVFRRSLQNVRSRDDYFSGAAHPGGLRGLSRSTPRGW